LVSLQDQRAYFFKGASLVGESRVSTGRAGFETPPGRFRIIEKDAAHVSNLYGSFVGEDGKVLRASVDISKDKPPEGASFVGSPMPWFLRFSQGFGFHAGQVPRRPASHGCVRLPAPMARHFFDSSDVGTPVLVQEARKLGLPVYEGYGLSECASVVSLNTPAHDLAGSAGHVLPHVQLSNANGELVVSGNTMLGYVGELQSWYPKTIATGDIGHVDGNGFVHISGRSKNLLISSYGRNIAPEWVESELLATPLLADAVVYGDAQPYCVALVSPRDPATPDALIQTVINATNMRLPDYAQVQRWHRLPAMLATNPQLLTANGRPRRAAIAAAFAGELAALYPATPALSRTAGAGA
jgi:acyl-CoA synthetase (AMP-forming)/AMP-acid ligase II